MGGHRTLQRQQPPTNLRPNDAPPPFVMCTEGEATDRQAHMELSEFESSCDTYSLGPRHRKANPQLVVKKYRRSAAGGGVSSASSAARGAARDIDSLVSTISHLLGFVLPKQSVYDHSVMPPRSLSSCVSFIDDRVRAVQVDLTTSLLSPSRTARDWAKIRMLQAKLVRYGILVSYLLKDVPSTKYESKFGKTALRTAIDSYFAAWEASFGSGDFGNSGSVGMPNQDELEVRDEILSYEALMHVAEGFLKSETALPTYDGAAGGGEGGSGAVLASYLGRGGSFNNDLVDENMSDAGKTRKREKLSKWSTSLEVAAAADQGNLIRIFRLLEGKDGSSCRWTTLARCCLSPAINVVRIGLARRYNKSFGKAEKITGDDLARLLCLSSSDAAIQFCSDIGLPTEGGNVIMKAAPIAITEAGAVKKMMNPCRANEDCYVFGECVLKSWSAAEKEEKIPAKTSSLSTASKKPSSLAAAAKSSSLAAAAKKPTTLVTAITISAPTHTNEDEWENAAENLNYGKKEKETSPSRIDQDGVAVPPGNVIWSIIS